MFEYIKGTLIRKSDTYAVVEVSGIAFKIFTSARSLQGAGKTGGEATFHTYLHVREDIFDLYGFTTSEERASFEMLLGVSGVGPRAALNILSTIAAESLALAIVTNDAKTITAAQGVGPKLAQRIILELKDKIKTEDLTKNSAIEMLPTTLIENEAVEALIVLGYPAAMAVKSVKAVGNGFTLEETIKRALSQFTK